MSYTVGGGGRGGLSSSSSSSSSTPIASARKVSREKVNESVEEEDLDLDIKTDHSRRSLPTTSKAKPFETTPISSVELMVPSKDESSSEKRTRGGRKPTALSEVQKEKKIARRRNKRGQSPEVYELAAVKSIEAEDDHLSEAVDKQVDGQKEEAARANQADGVSAPKNRSESNTQHQLSAKNSTDVKLKNELLADWSEDEQEEDDEGVKESGQAAADKKVVEDIPTAEKKNPPPKESSPVRTVVGKASTNKRQHKESRQELGSKQTQASRKAIKAEAQNDDASAILGKDEQIDMVKEVEKDLECSQEDSGTGAVA
uniref:Uncharacterized protein n=1 Tax=Anopheles maculatus TaxID=74869 RepID=A0A182SVV0_9DIPT